MTRQQLETLASEKPEELALLFAQKVAGDKYAVISTWGDSRDIQIMKNRAFQEAQRMLTDWTAVINAGKKAGIEWDRMVQRDSFPTYWAYAEQTILNPLKLDEAECIHQQPNWPDCAALMIVMIEVMEAKL